MSDLPIMRVPVADVTVVAYHAVFTRLSAVLEFGWLPLLVLLGVSIAPAALPPNFGGHSGTLRVLPDLVELIVGAFCLNAFGVRWYQVQLFGLIGATGRSWLKPWGRFMLYTFALYVTVGVAAAAAWLLAAAWSGTSPTLIAMPAAVLLVAVPLWLGAARLSLLFPAAAAGQRIGLRGAWRAMRGNTWRFILCGFFAGAPLVLGVQIVMGTVFAGFGLGRGATPPMGLFILRGVVDTVGNFLLVALSAVVLTEFYKRLVQAETN